jgi:hypothetical protein
MPIVCRRFFDRKNKMNLCLAIYSCLKCAGIGFATSVPCVNQQKLLDLVDKGTDIIHVPVAREEEVGVCLCAGAWMGAEGLPLPMQNSGLGNCINALASLDILYGNPLLMVISHSDGIGLPGISYLSPQLNRRRSAGRGHERRPNHSAGGLQADSRHPEEREESYPHLNRTSPIYS